MCTAGGSCPLPLSVVCSQWTLSSHGCIFLVLRTLARMSLPCHCRELRSITRVFHFFLTCWPFLAGSQHWVVRGSHNPHLQLSFDRSPSNTPKECRAGPASLSFLSPSSPSSHAPHGQSAVGKSRAGTAPGPTSSAVAPLSARPGRTRSRAVARTCVVGRRMFTAAEVGAAQPGHGRARGARGAPGRGLGSPISRAGRARR